MPVSKVGIPRIDPNVQYVGVSKLRTLNATNLHNLDKTLVIQDDDKPLAVVLSYDQFLEMQNEREKILATLETVLSDEGASLITALQDTMDGNTKPISVVRRTLRKGSEKRRTED